MNEKNPTTPELPDLFRKADGSRVSDVTQWQNQRQHLAKLIADHEYGQLPPAPTELNIELLHEHRYAAFDGAKHKQYRVSCELDGPVQFIFDLTIPSSVANTQRPVLLSGDGCWCYVTAEVRHEALSRGYIVAQFNRVELASDPSIDPGHGVRTSGLHAAWPEGDFGAIAAWAWGYSRAVDALHQIEEADTSRIVITGHSRGGKAALLAGAMDERIAMTAANGSGCGGAACYRWLRDDAEKLEVLARLRPSWFCKAYANYADRESALPIDQHMLLALIAPRPLLLTEALGDLWANPEGTRQCTMAAREAYAWLDQPQQVGLHYRGGLHTHSYQDFLAILDFADWRLHGLTPARHFDPAVTPFNHLPRIWHQQPTKATS